MRPAVSGLDWRYSRGLGIPEMLRDRSEIPLQSWGGDRKSPPSSIPHHPDPPFDSAQDRLPPGERETKGTGRDALSRPVCNLSSAEEGWYVQLPFGYKCGLFGQNGGGWDRASFFGCCGGGHVPGPLD